MFLKKWVSIICHPLSMFPLFLVIAWLYKPYTPAEVTNGQSIPRFLQGSTDWGGSNIFVVQVIYLIVFGLLHSLYLSAVLRGSQNTFLVTLKYAFKKLWFSWLLFLLVIFQFLPGLFSDYFSCESFMTTSLFGILYILTIFFVVSLHHFSIREGIRLLLAPLPIILFVVLARGGLTFKAGQVLNAYNIPSCSSSGLTHFVLTYPQRFCPGACSEN